MPSQRPIEFGEPAPHQPLAALRVRLLPHNGAARGEPLIAERRVLLENGHKRRDRGLRGDGHHVGTR